MHVDVGTQKLENMKFIVDLYLDGYETEEEMKEACLEFIYNQLNFSGSCVTVEPLDNNKQ